MADKKVTKKKLEKKKWVSNFTLIGEVKVNDYTYKINEKSEKSDWIYNTLNLGVDCGEKFGTVYSELMGGYGSERDNIIYVHGKKDDDTDDFDNKFTIDWDDREDEGVLKSIGDLCFIKVGIEKDKHDKTFVKSFLSAFDAIAYVKEHLTDGAVVNVKGSLKYSIYNDKVQVKKEISSIFLSKVEDKTKYSAKFTQTMLLKKDSIGKLDKEKGIIPVYGIILEYFKLWKNKEVKQFIPLERTFELEVDINNRASVETWINKILKVKKGVTEMTFDGDLIEGGALIETTINDLPDDIKELIVIGAYTEEEALAKCTENAGKDKRLVIRKPAIKMVGEDGSKIPVVQKQEEKYAEEDLILDFMFVSDDDEEEEEKPVIVKNKSKSNEVLDETETTDDDWLSQL